MSIEYRECSVCKTKRDRTTLVYGVCPFCTDTTSVVGEQPKKTRQKRSTSVKLAETPAPSPSEPLPGAQTAPDAPYTPPAFDDAAATANPQAELAARELARRRLLRFIMRFRPKYLAGWVHEDICRRLERFLRAVEAGESPRLLILCPPRLGKSEIGSRHFVPWALGQHPDWEIIAASHTASLTLSFSRYIRDLLRDPAYQVLFPECKLDPSSQSTENWNLTMGGGYLAAGVGSGITGRGCFTRNTVLWTPLQSDSISLHSVRVGSYVYGYDHKTRRFKQVKVLAVSLLRTTTPIVRVEDIECTENHEFAVSLEGAYLPAGELKANMPVVRWSEGQGLQDVQVVLLSGAPETVDGEDLSVVRGQEGGSCGGVQELSYTSAAQGGDDIAGLRTLRGRVQSQAARVRGRVAQAWSHAGVLFSKVLSRCAERIERKGFLQGLREASSRERAEGLLLTPVLLENTGEGCIQAIQLRVSGNKEAAVDSAQLYLFDVCAEELQSGSAPHRPRRGKQQSFEPDVVVLSLSQVVSRTPGVCARDLEAFVSDTDGELVADIQTETGNFFCGDARLLVHNCHILCVDDVVKDMESADSQTIRDNIWEWYCSTAYTRLAPGGGVLGILTHWHEEDWAGKIMQAMDTGDGDTFEIVRYPAINDHGDEYLLPDDRILQIAPPDVVPEGARLTRAHGTALHPARYDTEAVTRIKRNLYASGQQRVWSALYQQSPAPDEGLFFTKEMFRYYGSPPPRQDLYIYQAWDFAISTGKESDYTVGVTLGQDHRDNLYVLDVRRFRSDNSLIIVDQLVEYAREHDATLVGFEDGQIWKTLEAQYLKRCDELRYYPSYEVLKPLTDKMVRASPLRGRMQLGKVYFDEKAPWFRDLFFEFTRFPAGKHDDIIDSMAWAVRLTLTRAAPKQRDTQPKTKSWKDKLNLLTGETGASHMSA